jgi:NOL1/NOP2/sun family putative RNA methylase
MELPEQFIARMEALLGDEWNAFLDAFHHHPVNRALRINTRKISEEQFLKAFREKLFQLPFGKALYQLPNSWLLGNHPYFHAGGMYLQEPSACLPGLAAEVKSDFKVLDLCAAPGGKSTQILDQLENGFLVANEINYSRAKVLAGNIERMGYPNAIVTCNKPVDFLTQFQDYFDLVIVDAPCSGEGMFRKEPEAVANWSVDNVLMCSRRQTEILNVASRLVKPGGRIVYSTCTFAREENEDVISRFLKDCPDFGMIKARDEVILNSSPAFEPLVTYGRRVFPHKSLGEGHFIAVMSRASEVQYLHYTKESAFFLSVSKAMLEAIRPVISEIIPSLDERKLYRVRNGIHYLRFVTPPLEGLNVLSTGVKVGTFDDRKRFSLDHHLAHAFPIEAYRHVLNFSLDDEKVRDYLAGYEISTEGENGLVVVAVDSMGLGFGKAVNGTVKNYYPKGLRNLVKNFEKY